MDNKKIANELVKIAKELVAKPADLDDTLKRVKILKGFFMVNNYASNKMEKNIKELEKILKEAESADDLRGDNWKSVGELSSEIYDEARDIIKAETDKIKEQYDKELDRMKQASTLAQRVSEDIFSLQND